MVVSSIIAEMFAYGTINFVLSALATVTVVGAWLLLITVIIKALIVVWRP